LSTTVIFPQNNQREEKGKSEEGNKKWGRRGKTEEGEDSGEGGDSEGTVTTSSTSNVAKADNIRLTARKFTWPLSVKYLHIKISRVRRVVKGGKVGRVSRISRVSRVSRLRRVGNIGSVVRVSSIRIVGGVYSVCKVR
jgi:hypothetical protein